MSEEVNAPDAMQFDHQERDVTCCIVSPIFVCYTLCRTNMRLGITFIFLFPIYFFTCRISLLWEYQAYGELGTVDINHVCCFVGFAANSLMTKQDSCQATGCGCEEEKVNDIVTELKKRQAFRGDRAKVRLAETTLSSIQDLNAKVDLILNHLNITPPETAKAVTAVTSDTMTR
eukprot:CCRYP_003158-RA/>CCRYP_003158-RA protein AED:0.17 eAED:0.17 QI:252/0.5/0.8/1/0.75/0.8/5/229/173